MIGKAAETTQITLKDSTIWGESEQLPSDSGGYCKSIYGYWLASSAGGGTSYPAKSSSQLPYHKIKSNANWFTEAYANNVKFKNWKSASRICNNRSEQKIFFIVPSNADHVPVNTFTNTEFVNVNHNALASLNDPNPGWANLADCGQFPCTAPHNAIIKFKNAKASGSLVPNIKLIESGSGTNFQILPDNPQATNFVFSCSRVAAWNANLCYNERVAQIMFESLDSDKEDRTFSPINILGKSNSFNNTLNSFMDHCWDGHYTCQKRLSRFPGLVETNKRYELYFTGTQPIKTRYTLEGGQVGLDWVQILIDFSQSRIFKVFANNKEVEANKFNRATKKHNPVQRVYCGEHTYTKLTYIYEFYLPYGCTIRLEGQDVLEGMVRFQMTYEYFFELGGTSWFADKFASVLGISQDRIRVVGIAEGSVIIDFYLTSNEPTQTERLNDLVEMKRILSSQYAAGILNFEIPILDLIFQIISANGTVTTSETRTSDPVSGKEISIVIYIFLCVSGFSVIVGLIVGLSK